MTIDLTGLIPAAIIFAVMYCPVLLAVSVVYLQRRAEAGRGRRSPLNEKLLHQPGAHARRKADDLGDDIMARTAFLLLIGPLAMLILLLTRVQWRQIRLNWLDWLVVAGVIAAVLWCIGDIVRFRRERRNWLNGMYGEMASAQAIDRLRVHGCEVFHDLPGHRGNIDHVVVSPTGVFALETKWRSKHGKGANSAEVWFDGQSLEFPGGSRDSAPIEQARACAAELAKYLTGRTGDMVRVVPVVTLPGWYTKNRQSASTSELIVINPKMSAMLAKYPGPAIPESQRNRIIHAIAERYPELES